jgi:hypothetical protein
MKALVLFPLAYLAGVQGFLLFAPYAIAFLALALVLRLRAREAREALVPVRVRSDRSA